MAGKSACVATTCVVSDGAYVADQHDLLMEEFDQEVVCDETSYHHENSMLEMDAEITPEMIDELNAEMDVAMMDYPVEEESLEISIFNNNTSVYYCLMAKRTISFKETKDPHIVDSGCSTSMINDVDLLIEQMVLKSPIVIELADNSLLQATTIGTLRLAGKHGIILVPGTLYVPGLRKRLLSVKHLLRMNLSVLFEKDDCLIKDSGCETILHGQLGSSGLYEIVLYQAADEKLGPTGGYCLYSSQKLLSDVKVWHERLCHLSIPTTVSFIKNTLQLKPTGMIENCDICKVAKATRNTFVSSTHHPTRYPLELVTSDVWGPSKTKSRNGFAYFVLFL